MKTHVNLNINWILPNNIEVGFSFWSNEGINHLDILNLGQSLNRHKKFYNLKIGKGNLKKGWGNDVIYLTSFALTNLFLIGSAVKCPVWRHKNTYKKKDCNEKWERKPAAAEYLSSCRAANFEARITKF